jgi:hypothetical protein
MPISIQTPPASNPDPTTDKERPEHPYLANHKDAEPKEPPHFPFLSLPKELRLQICTYLSAPTHKPIDPVSPPKIRLLVCLHLPPLPPSLTRHPR